MNTNSVKDVTSHVIAVAIIIYRMAVTVIEDIFRGRYCCGRHCLWPSLYLYRLIISSLWCTQYIFVTVAVMARKKRRKRTTGPSGTMT